MINNIHSPHQEKQNITLAERKAIEQLISNRDIIIKPADKGSGVVIMNTSDYVFEAYRQLNDINFYQALDNDLTLIYEMEISRFLSVMFQNKEIDISCFMFLNPQNTKPGRFYLLPKIHKGKLPPPGRPIVSAIGSPTEKISAFLDFFLQPYLPKLRSYVKDTGHFLYLIDQLGRLPDNAILVTLDVTSLYTNITLEEARRAIALLFISNRGRNSVPKNDSLLRLLSLIFTKTFSLSVMVKHRHTTFRLMELVWVPNVPPQWHVCLWVILNKNMSILTLTNL